MPTNLELVNFIKESKARGFEDFQIREPLLAHGWLAQDIEKAFSYLRPKTQSKNRIQIHLNDAVLKKLEKRAEKNMLNLNEQIEDILRRSVINLKKATPIEEKVDDKLITFFSRKKR
jgi:hypothetical protein